MIKHVVCFKINNKTDELLKETKNILLSMKENVPTVREIEVGIDFLGSPRSYDVYLSVVLDSKEALDVYQNDAYHVDVVKKHMHAICESSIAIDFEI